MEHVHSLTRIADETRIRFDRRKILDLMRAQNWFSLTLLPRAIDAIHQIPNPLRIPLMVTAGLPTGFGPMSTRFWRSPMNIIGDCPTSGELASRHPSRIA